VAEEPDRIRDDIELTRARLATDVDRLADRTSPSRVAQRGWQRTKERARGVSDRVMGTASSGGHAVKDSAADAAGTVQEKAGDVADQLRRVPDVTIRQTRGNPIAAGLIAFGAGLLTASLLPATELEKRAGRQVRDHADDLVEPVRGPLTEAAQDLGQRAKEAAASVGETAGDAARTTAQSAKATAKDAGAEVKQNVSGSA